VEWDGDDWSADEREAVARQVDYDNISYCPGLPGTAPIVDLLIQSPARHYLDDWLGWDAIAHDGG
jgi:hypothetical protein